MTNTDLLKAKEELKSRIDLLYGKIESLIETEDDFQLEPHQNIIENFSQRNNMACKECEAMFTSWEELDLHNSVHHAHNPADPRTRGICKAVFSSWQEKDTHVLVVHPLDTRTFQPTLPHIQVSTLLCCDVLCCTVLYSTLVLLCTIL